MYDTMIVWDLLTYSALFDRWAPTYTGLPDGVNYMNLSSDVSHLRQKAVAKEFSLPDSYRQISIHWV